MDSVICYCQQCGHELGRFWNAWHGIGNTYCSPIHPVLMYDKGFEATGESNPTTAESTIAHSYLQDLNCLDCGTPVGLRCDSAPEGHILATDQLILQKSSISVVSATSGSKTDISILKSFSLNANEDSKRSPPVSPRPSLGHPVGHDISENAQLGARRMSSSPAPSAVPSTTIKNPVPGFPEFQVWAQDAIDRQQRDIDRISTAMSSIEDKMQQFSDFMRDVCAELKEHQRLQQVDNIDREVLADLQVDISNLNKKADKIERENLRSKSGVSLSRDIEIIISDMVTVSDKANEIDDVKIGLQEVRSQIKTIKQLATENSIVQGPAGFRVGGKVDDSEHTEEATAQSLPPVKTPLPIVEPRARKRKRNSQSLDQTERRVLRSHKKIEVAPSAIGGNKALDQEKVARGTTALATTKEASKTIYQASPLVPSIKKRRRSAPVSKGPGTSKVEIDSAVNDAQKEAVLEGIDPLSADRSEEPFELGSLPVPSASYPARNSNSQNRMRPASLSRTESSNTLETGPYKCFLCPKQYSSISGLRYHKLNSTCKDKTKAENDQEVDKAQLLARREKLVTQMLEREMMAGI